MIPLVIPAAAAVAAGLVYLARKVHNMSASLDHLVNSAKAAVEKIGVLEGSVATLTQSNADLTAQVGKLTTEVADLTAEAGTSDAQLDTVSAELDAAVNPAQAPTPDPAPAPAV